MPGFGSHASPKLWNSSKMICFSYTIDITQKLFGRQVLFKTKTASPKFGRLKTKSDR